MDTSEAAGLAVEPTGPEEASLRRACGRLLHVDDAARIAAYRAFLARENAPQAADMAERERRLLRMLVGSLVDKVPRAALAKQAGLDEGCRLLWAHPAVRAELLELLDVLGGRISHVPQPLGARHAQVPLVAHARYSRIEILAAFGVGVAGREEEADADAAAAQRPRHTGTTAGGAGAGPGARVAPWQMGVYWAPEERADLLAFTLDKTSGAFSPTTRYRDYAVSRDLIHWESQNMVRADSPTGRRYQQHAAQGSSVMLFTRLRDDDRAFCFLGPATYVSHESERPMAITWRLEHPLPGDLFAAFAAAVAQSTGAGTGLSRDDTCTPGRSMQRRGQVDQSPCNCAAGIVRYLTSTIRRARLPCGVVRRYSYTPLGAGCPLSSKPFHKRV